MASVLCCIASRDGRLHEQVRRPLMTALQQAADAGVGCAVRLEVNHYGVTVCRNQAVASFLQTEHSHLLFIDDDVIVPDRFVSRLLESDADIVGGVYPYLRRDGESIRPVLSAKVNGEWPLDWFDGIQSAEIVGGGCMLIARDTFNAIGFPWFRWPEYLRSDGTVGMQSDDMDICQRAIAAGLRVEVHGNVRCGHMKEVDLRGLVGLGVTL